VPASGVLTRLDALAVGIAAWRLGAGRARKEDAVSFGAGVVMLAKPGDAVRAGEPLLELHADDPSRFDAALAALDGGIEISAEHSAEHSGQHSAQHSAEHRAHPLVIDRIG
jgi:thymidine phosphorylase